ncbi:MAG: homocysteine S-methyltransferase family protein [Myxococcota bacterium]
MDRPLDLLQRRLQAGPPLLLDGATGTELERRGITTTLPLWSARALLDHPEAVTGIHAAYVEAGVDLLTANTFPTQRRSLARAGLGEQAAALTRKAVELARQAAGDRPVAVLGSAPPLEDCYRPDLVPGDAELEREHAEHARNLARAAVDAVLVETINTLREARAALAAVAQAGLPALASFVCWDGARLLSGEPLTAALDVAAAAGALAVGVNCLPPSNVGACLPPLVASGLPACVYANLGAPLDDGNFQRSEECDPESFAEHALAWVEAGVRVIGGCCGTTPEHLSALAQRLHERHSSE